MTYSSRIDWCALAGALAGIAAILLGISYWIGGPVLLVLLLCAYPQSYETTARGLIVHDSLARRLIPFHAITLVSPVTRGRLRIQHGPAGSIVLAPADAKSLLADIASHTPHLIRRGEQLVLRDRYVEYRFQDLDYIPG